MSGFRRRAKVGTESDLLGGITDGSPAEAAGLQTGDVITQADGEPIETFQDLATRVRKKKPGDEMILEVRRDDTTFSVKVRIGKYEGSSVPPDPERPTGGLDLEDPPKKKDPEEVKMPPTQKVFEVRSV